jgi:FAD/FMN-containing dehydrogenase
MNSDRPTPQLSNLKLSNSGTSSSHQSWGRYPRANQVVIEPAWSDDPIVFEPGRSYLPFGLGRSYGDSCLNDGGVIISTRRLDRFLSFDSEKGLLTCEAGVSLADILSFSVPRQWFLPVTPGTKFVTLGGAIANDVHGKNHHRAGTFGCHVTEFELLRSSGEILRCSPERNAELYAATIGGLGLTGLIRSATLQLKKIGGPYIDRESVKFGSLDEFFEISAQSEMSFEYTVAWLDCVSTGKSFGRGLFFRGEHSNMPANGHRPGKPLLKVPFDFPGFALNKLSVSAFNQLYFHKQFSRIKKDVLHYDPFFYPLDSVYDWNRIYGSRGFLQFQCVIPTEDHHEALTRILRLIVDSGRASFLAVLKEFGDVPSPGMLSFPRKGVTLCLDFPNQGQSTLELLSRIDDIVRNTGGAQYPAKDSTMSGSSFKQYFPRWEEFTKYVDPKFSSSFWRRVIG